MDALTENHPPDTREALAKIKEPVEVGHESYTRGFFENPDTYAVKHEDGSIERFQIVQLGKESFVVRTKQQTIVKEDGGQKVVTFYYDS